MCIRDSRSSGVSLEKLKAGCLGSAGLSRPAEKEAFSCFFRRLLPQCSMYLCNDGETLLVGALEATEGYCLIAGTGSLALARDREGRTARAGGLGYMLGDEGSALWIAVSYTHLDVYKRQAVAKSQHNHKQEPRRP